MASHSYSFSLKLHVIRNIITTPYSSPQNTIFLCSGSTLGGGGGGIEYTMVASGVGKAGEVRREAARRWGGGWSPPFVAPGRSEVQKNSGARVS